MDRPVVYNMDSTHIRRLRIERLFAAQPHPHQRDSRKSSNDDFESEKHTQFYNVNIIVFSSNPFQIKVLCNTYHISIILARVT